MLSISKKTLYNSIVCILLIVLSGCLMTEGEKTQSSLTIEAADMLTKTHGAEVSQMITDFVLETGSIEANHNPEIWKKWVTDKIFSLRLSKDELNDEPYWIVLKSINIDHIRVIEYEPNEIKAIACETLVHEEYTTDGRYLETYPATMHCNIYVFVHEDSSWRVAAVFNTTHPDNVERDWLYASDWLKEVIGELPDDPSMIRERSQ